MPYYHIHSAFTELQRGTGKRGKKEILRDTWENWETEELIRELGKHLKLHLPLQCSTFIHFSKLVFPKSTLTIHTLGLYFPVFFTHTQLPPGVAKQLLNITAYSVQHLSTFPNLNLQDQTDQTYSVTILSMFLHTSNFQQAG